MRPHEHRGEGIRAPFKLRPGLITEIVRCMTSLGAAKNHRPVRTVMVRISKANQRSIVALHVCCSRRDFSCGRSNGMRRDCRSSAAWTSIGSEAGCSSIRCVSPTLGSSSRLAIGRRPRRSLAGGLRLADSDARTETHRRRCDRRTVDRGVSRTGAPDTPGDRRGARAVAGGLKTRLYKNEDQPR